MILNRYLFKEISNSFLGTLLILTVVIVGNSFVRLLSDASIGKLPADLLGQSLFYVSTVNLIRLIPVALLISMMLAFSRLYRDSEIVSMQAAGVSPYSLYKAIFTFVAPLSLLLLVLVLFVSPWASGQYTSIQRQVDERPEAAGIPPGTFKVTTTANGEFTLLAEDIEKNESTMHRFFAHIRNKNGESIIWGKTAALFIDSISGERILEIRNGARYEFPTDGTSRITHFVEHGINMPLKESHQISKANTLKTSELIQNPTVKNIAELHWRIAVILSAPLMALLALPLSYTNPRQGRYSKIAIGILIYAVYANFLLSGKSLLDNGRINAWIGLWWVHILLGIFIIWLIRRTFGRAK